MSLSHHLPVLQIVIPLVSAPIAMWLRREAAVWSMALVVSWVCFGIALALLGRVLNEGAVVYLLGDWAAPWGIEYRIDELGAIMLVLVSGIAAVVLPYARQSVKAEISADRIYLFYAMLILCLTGLLGIVVTGDAFNLFVFLEISSLSSYVLISMGRDRRALTASYRYLIMGTLGATFYVIGVGMLYMMTGTLNMLDLAGLVPAMADTKTLLVALAFLTVGISLKLALFPLHLWLPNAYAFAPSVVTAFLAATATKVAVYIMIRVYFTIYGGAIEFGILPVRDILMGLAVIAMFAGSLVAVWQHDVKRLLAYSSLAQIGYMILGLSFASIDGLAGGIVHMFNHALMKGTLFLAVGAMVLRVGSSHVDALAGIGKRMPLTTAAFVVGGLSLIGIPTTVGFVSKWALLQASLSSGDWPVAVLIVVSSMLAVAYVWRVVEIAYFKPAPAGAGPLEEAPWSMLIPLWVLACACVWFGLNGKATLGFAVFAAASLMGGPQ